VGGQVRDGCRNRERREDERIREGKISLVRGVSREQRR